MQHLTVVATFSDEDRIAAIIDCDPHKTRIYTRPNHEIVYIENGRERWVAADRWGMEPGALADFITATGGEGSYTSPAAYGYSLYRRKFAPVGFWLAAGDWRSRLCRDALYGGRCEVYHYTRGDNPETLHMYDINSSYPYASLLLSYPDPRTLAYNRLPDIETIRRSEGVSTVVFSQEGDYPILPVYYAGRNLYPHSDHVTGTYTHTELRYAMDRGVLIHKVLKQFIAGRNLADNPFAKFIGYCWDQKETGQPIYKAIMNGFFGRLSINTTGLLCFRPTVYHRETFRSLPLHLRGYFGRYVCAGGVESTPPTANPLWAAMVLSMARVRLHNRLTPTCCYCDTDCVIDRLPLDLPLSRNLGDWKYKTGPFMIRGAKAYAYRAAPDGSIIYKLKGIARQYRSERDFFAARRTGERKILRNGRTVPHTVVNYTVTKPLQSAIMD